MGVMGSMNCNVNEGGWVEPTETVRTWGENLSPRHEGVSQVEEVCVCARVLHRWAPRGE